MESPRLLVGFFILACFDLSHQHGVSDLVSWSMNIMEGRQIQESGPSDSPSYCSCTGPHCKCCIDFNTSFIDLGGPGCVQMRYSDDEKVLLVNVTYGESDLHSEKIQAGPKPVATCMDLLPPLLQVCAAFTELKQGEYGMNGCVALEPTFLTQPQGVYRLGCFKMEPGGMKFSSPPPVNSSEESSEEESSSGSLEPDSEEALIAAVNQSAEESIALFSSLLGLGFGSPSNSTEATSEATETTQFESTTQQSETKSN